MRGLETLIIVFGLLVLNTCNGQDKLNQYNNTYEIGQIPGLESFMKFTDDELRMDSIIKENTVTGWGAFKINRSRIFLDEYINGKIRRKDTAFYGGLPAPCQCFTDNDTLFIKMESGFFGGLGFKLKIYKENFESGFFTYTDDVKPYKSDLKDTAFYDYAQVSNRFQHLVFKDKPAFKAEQQITGLLTYTTNNYYEKNYSGSLDTIFVTGKIYFTCKTRKKTLFDTQLWER